MAVKTASDRVRESNRLIRQMQLYRQQHSVRALLEPSNRQSLSFDPNPQASRDKTAKIQGRGW